VRVLVVEDEERIARFLVKGFTAAGLQVEHVADAAAALARLDGPGPGVDVCTLDITLPGASGIELLRRVRDRGDALPVVVLTASVDPRDEAESRALGVVAFLVKPVAFAALLAAVRAAPSAPLLSGAAPPPPGARPGDGRAAPPGRAA